MLFVESLSEKSCLKTTPEPQKKRA